MRITNLSRKLYIIVCSLCVVILLSCADTSTSEPKNTVVLDTTPYLLDLQGLPPQPPNDNKLTVQTVKLGRMLFYDKQLSKDGTQACASCHQQKDGFSDIRKFSIGVENLPGKRQAMPIFNLAWHKGGFFWDGRAATLREQSLKPIQDPLEMNETLDNVVKKVSSSLAYKDQFIRAFGTDSVSAYRISLALEQFMFTIVSANSKFDKVSRNQATYTESEERGRKLYTTENDVKGAECFHCHGGFNFTNDKFSNNGLDEEPNITDMGRFNVTSNPRDKGTFKVPSLRNVAVTAPYMHDGRFATLEEVIEHYNHGVKKSPTVDPALHFNVEPEGLKLSQQDIADIVAFLKTLTDETYLNNSTYSSP